MILDSFKSLSKPRDFVITTFIGLSVFIFINYNDKFRELIPVNYWLVVCLFFGLAISKVFDMRCIKQDIDKRKSLKRCKSLIKRLKLDILKKGFTRSDKKMLANLNKDAENILTNYEESIIELECFKKRVNDLVHRYEKVIYLILEIENPL